MGIIFMSEISGIKFGFMIQSYFWKIAESVSFFRDYSVSLLYVFIIFKWHQKKGASWQLMLLYLRATSLALRYLPDTQGRRKCQAQIQTHRSSCSLSCVSPINTQNLFVFIHLVLIYKGIVISHSLILIFPGNKKAYFGCIYSLT